MSNTLIKLWISHILLHGQFGGLGRFYKCLITWPLEPFIMGAWESWVIVFALMPLNHVAVQ